MPARHAWEQEADGHKPVYPVQSTPLPSDEERKQALLVKVKASLNKNTDQLSARKVADEWFGPPFLSDDKQREALTALIAAHTAGLRARVEALEKEREQYRTLIKSDTQLGRDLITERDSLRAELTNAKAHIIFQSDALKSPTDVYELIRRDELAALRVALNASEERVKTLEAAKPEHWLPKSINVSNIAARERNLTADLTTARAKIAALENWKQEAITVESWWKEIDTFIRNHPKCPLGHSVPAIALGWLRDRDNLKGCLAALESQREDQMQALGLANDDHTDIAAVIRRLRDEGRGYFHEITRLEQERDQWREAGEQDKNRLFEVVDSTDDDRYYTLGIFHIEADAMSLLDGAEPPINEDDHESVTIEVRSRPIGFHPHDFTEVASRTWFRNFHDEGPDWENAKWKSHPIKLAAMRATGEQK